MATLLFLWTFRRKSAPAIRPDFAMEAKEATEVLEEKEVGKLIIESCEYSSMYKHFYLVYCK